MECIYARNNRVNLNKKIPLSGNPAEGFLKILSEKVYFLTNKFFLEKKIANAPTISMVTVELSGTSVGGSGGNSKSKSKDKLMSAVIVLYMIWRKSPPFQLPFLPETSALVKSKNKRPL